MTCCTTLNRIRAKGPCEDRWKKLLKHLGKTSADDEPLPLSVIVESNGLDDALWCCRTVDYDRVWRLYAVWCARQVQHLMKDAPSIAALDVAQDYAIGLATRDELERAWAAAWAAAAAAAAARDAQRAMFLRVVNTQSEDAAAEILKAAMPRKESKS
jgi:hypothetical protein